MGPVRTCISCNSEILLVYTVCQFRIPNKIRYTSSESALSKAHRRGLRAPAGLDIRADTASEATPRLPQRRTQCPARLSQHTRKAWQTPDAIPRLLRPTLLPLGLPPQGWKGKRRLPPPRMKGERSACRRWGIVLRRLSPHAKQVRRLLPGSSDVRWLHPLRSQSVLSPVHPSLRLQPLERLWQTQTGVQRPVKPESFRPLTL